MIMKMEKFKEYSGYQKLMIILIPIIILLLIASIITLAAMWFTHNFGGFGILSPGSIVIVMALCSTVLAVIGIVFAFVSAGKETDEEDEE